MATLYDKFGNDQVQESVTGIRLVYDDAVFIVRRAGGSNLKYQAEVRKLVRPVRKQIEYEQLGEKEQQQIYMRAHARAVVIGWENVTDRNGNQMPFTEENFVKLMSDLPDLWDAFSTACADATNFRALEIKDDGTALGNSFSGKPNGEQ